MKNLITFTDELTGIEHINIINEDGSIIGMTKAHYEELEAQREQSGTL